MATRFFTKGKGAGRKVIPIKSSTVSKYTYKSEHSGYSPKDISFVNYYVNPQYVNSRNLKKIQDKIVSKIGKKKFDRLTGLYSNLSSGSFDKDKFMRDYLAKYPDTPKVHASKVMLVDIPKGLRRSKQIARPELVLKGDISFMRVGLNEGVPRDVLVDMLILNTSPSDFISGDFARPKHWFNKIYGDVGLIGRVKEHYASYSFSEDPDFIVDEGMTVARQNQLVDDVVSGKLLV